MSQPITNAELEAVNSETMEDLIDQLQSEDINLLMTHAADNIYV